MKQHVAVGVPGESMRVLQRDATDFQRHAFLKLVRIPTVANPHGKFLSTPRHKNVKAEPQSNSLSAELQMGEQVDEPRAELRSEEHTSELQSHVNLVCRLLLEKKK